jgi:hypothetical protein
MITGTPPPSALEAAILRTVLYADVFNFPLTPAEAHHYLIGQRATLIEVQTVLDCSEWLKERLQPPHPSTGYIALRGRESILTERERRHCASQTLFPRAERYGRWLARLPFVRMVALTGALAVGNAHDEDDDLDYLIVTRAGRVWLARAFTVVLVRVTRVWGVHLCPNYVLAETALAQESHDLYIAHEIAQMIPLSGHHLYAQLRALNTWTFQHLPNAHRPYLALRGGEVQGAWKLMQRLLEALLSGKIGGGLEVWEHDRKRQKFAPQLQTPHAHARIDAQHVKGHFNDYGYPTLRKYHEKLIEYGLSSHESPQEDI